MNTGLCNCSIIKSSTESSECTQQRFFFIVYLGFHSLLIIIQLVGCLFFPAFSPLGLSVPYPLWSLSLLTLLLSCRKTCITFMVPPTHKAALKWAPGLKLFQGPNLPKHHHVSIQPAQAEATLNLHTIHQQSRMTAV